MKDFFPGYLLFFLLFLSNNLLSQNCFDEKALFKEYAFRRAALMNMIDTGSAIVMRAALEDPGQDMIRFRQEQDFFYLTGIEEPRCALIILPKGMNFVGRMKKVILFAPSSTSLYHEKGKYSREYDTIVGIDEFSALFNRLPGTLQKLYFAWDGPGSVQDWLNDKTQYIALDIRKNLKRKFPNLSLGDPYAMIHQLREIKTTEEVNLIKKAIALTGLGIVDAAKQCKPGMWEYELKALIEFRMISGGAEGQAFPSIVGAGQNNMILHYCEDHCQVNDGDLVVMDVGAQYHGYAADITRTIPVSGKFTKPQLAVYNIVLRTQEEIISSLKPGMTMSGMDRKAIEIITKAGFLGYIRHGVTHTLGLDVHDVNCGDTLRPGMVVTVEPGIYIPADDDKLPEGFKGFGIRIEDDVLITENGCEVLSREIPKKASEIEALMKKQEGEVPVRR